MMTIVRGIVHNGYVEPESPLPEGTAVEILVPGALFPTPHAGTPHFTWDESRSARRTRPPVDYPTDGFMEDDLGGESG